VALGDIHRHFAWHAWHLWHWAGPVGALGSQMTPWTPRLFAWQVWHLATWSGIWRHPPSLCVAGVALMALGWPCRRAWFPDDAVDAAAFCQPMFVFNFVQLLGFVHVFGFPKLTVISL